MKRILTLIFAALMLATVLCGCGKNADPNTPDRDNSVSTSDKGEKDGENEKGGNTDVSLPNTYELAATDPHYTIAVPAWSAEGYGYGFSLNEKGNKKYAIVVACGSDAEEEPLEDAFSALYNDTFNAILMRNYRAKYEEIPPKTDKVTLANGSPALRFQDVQPADDYGTKLSCPVYGYGFFHDGVPFIVAYIVMDETAADDAKQAEMKGYVDAMVNTVRTAQ